MKTQFEVGDTVVDPRDCGEVCRVREDYHAGRDEVITLVTVRWPDGQESQHTLKELEQSSEPLAVLAI